MLKKGLSFIASEDYSFGFHCIEENCHDQILSPRPSCFPCIEKVDLLLPASCVASSWEPLKKRLIIFLHVCTRYRYMFDIFLKQISWPRLPSRPFSSLSQLIGIHRRCNGIFARRSIALDALTDATCNNFPHYNWKTPPKKNIQLRSFKKPSAPVHPWCFCRCPQHRQKIGNRQVVLRSSSWWCSDHFYIKLYVLRSKLYQKKVLNTYTIYSVHICIIYVIFIFSYQKTPNLIFLFRPPSTSPSNKVHRPSPLPKSDSLAPGMFFHHKKRGLGIPTSGFVMLKSIAHTMVSPWKLQRRSITLNIMMIGDRKIVYQILGSWSCIPNNFHLWLDEAFESFRTIPLKSPTSKRILRYLKRFASA